MKTCEVEGCHAIRNYTIVFGQDHLEKHVCVGHLSGTVQMLVLYHSTVTVKGIPAVIEGSHEAGDQSEVWPK